jgi:hypothetical protein
VTPTLADYRHPPRVRRLLASLVPVVCPLQAQTLGLTDAIVEHVELSMRALPTAVRLALVAGLTTYELGALARHRRRASRLDAARARDYFAWWRRGTSIQRELARGVRGLLCLACYEMPAMQEAIGYRPAGWIERVKRRRLEIHGDAIAAHQASLFEPDPLPPLVYESRTPADEARAASEGIEPQEAP